MKQHTRALRNNYLPALLFLLFAAFGASGQGYLPTLNNNYRYKRVWVDPSGTFRVPYGATPSLNGDPSLLPGAFYFRTTDTSFYGWTGTQWLKLPNGLNYQTRLRPGFDFQYRKGNDSLGNFLQDAYDGLRPYFMPRDSSLDASRINNLTPFTRALFSGVGRISVNQSTGQILLDTAGLGSGGSTPNLSAYRLFGRYSNSTGPGQELKPDPASLTITGDTLKAITNKDSVMAFTRMASFTTVAELRASTLASNGARLALTRGYHTSGDGGAAEYRWDVSSTAADDGIFVIDPALPGPGRWLLKYEGQVNFRQAGGRSDNVTDNTPIFSAILANANATGIDFPSTGLYLVGDGSLITPRFYFADTLKVLRRFDLRGQGPDATILHVPKGLQVYANQVQWTGFRVVANTSAASTGFNSSTAHGIRVHSNGGIYRGVYVNNFDSDGWHLAGDVNAGTNANNNVFDHCGGQANGRFGTYAAGGDANNLLYIGGDYSYNARWGVIYSGFLQSKFLGLHNASNGHQHPLNKTIVTHNGVVYTCRTPNVNIRPDSAGVGDYWRVLPISPLFATVWNRTEQFWDGGGYTVTEANPSVDFDNCYVEPDQYVMRGNGRTAVNYGELALYAYDGVSTMRVAENAHTFENLQVRSKQNGSSLRISSGGLFGNPSIAWRDGNSAPGLALERHDATTYGFTNANLGSTFNVRIKTLVEDGQNRTRLQAWGGLDLGDAGYGGTARVTVGGAQPANGFGSDNDIVVNVGGPVGIVWWRKMSGAWIAIYAGSFNDRAYFDATAAIAWLKRATNSDGSFLVFDPPGTLSASNPRWHIGTQAGSNNLDYLLFDGTTATTRFTVTVAGNVGIGTTSPGQRLTVAGTIESTTGGVRFPDGSVQTTAAQPTTAANVGTGESIYRDNTGSVINLRKLAGPLAKGVKVETNGDAIEVSNNAYALYYSTTNSTTTDNTQDLTIINGLPTNGAGIVTIEAEGYNTVTNAVSTIVQQVSFRRASGTTALGTTTITKAQEQIGAFATTPVYAFAVDASNNIVYRITGSQGQNVTWKVIVKVNQHAYQP